MAAELPSLNWQEREIQDWFGLEAEGHPNPRRVALHDNWPDVHPLRKDFPLRDELPPFEGERHVYRPTLGEGVFQVPVGPVHAGIIEPGHFSFAVAGEPILYLQLRMFYVHKGTEKLFEDMPIHRAVFLAESISGDSAFSHGTAFCQAIEAAGGDRSAVARAGDAHDPAGTGARVQPHRGHRRDRDGRRVSWWPMRTPGGCGNWRCGVNEALSGQPAPARDGVRRRRAARLVGRAASRF